MRSFNRDLFGCASPREVGKASMAVVDELQAFPPEVQMAGACATFILLAEAAGVPVADAFTTVKNIMNHADGKRPEFKAVADYIKHEL